MWVNGLTIVIGEFADRLQVLFTRRKCSLRQVNQLRVFDFFVLEFVLRPQKELQQRNQFRCRCFIIAKLVLEDGLVDSRSEMLAMRRVQQVRAGWILWFLEGQEGQGALQLLELQMIAIDTKLFLCELESFFDVVIADKFN